MNIHGGSPEPENESFSFIINVLTFTPAGVLKSFQYFKFSFNVIFPFSPETENVDGYVCSEVPFFIAQKLNRIFRCLFIKYASVNSLEKMKTDYIYRVKNK